MTTVLSENFNSYAAGDLVGQNGWTQLGAPVTNPIQVAGGQVVIPAIAAGAAADNQDAYKSFSSSVAAPTAGSTVSVIATINLNVSAAQANPAFIFALTDTPSGFANERVTAKDNGGGTYVLGARVTGQTGYPFAFGTTGLAYNTAHTLVVEADLVAGASNDDVKLFVDPPSSDPDVLNGLTPYATATYSGSGSVADPTALGVAILSQFASATVGQDGVSISSIVITATPEPTSIASVASVAGWLSFRRRRVHRPGVTNTL